MKKINKFFLIFILTSLFVSCSTTKSIQSVRNNSQITLEKDEGIILLRILNPHVGKVIDEFYYANGESVKNSSPLRLNSDLQIKKAPGSFSVFTVANTEAPEQIVLLKAKKGSYGIIKVGENSEYFNPYVFKVTAGVVNYTGDIKLDIVTGQVLVWHKVKDYYDLSVSDNFEQVLSLKESSDLLSDYSGYAFVNQSKNIEKMKPLYCHVIREN